jgi:hypothetical protein
MRLFMNVFPNVIISEREKKPPLKSTCCCNTYLFNTMPLAKNIELKNEYDLLN